MRYRQKFTGLGLTGVALLICAPVVAGLALSSYAADLSYTARLPTFPLAVSGFAGLIGALLVLVGRETYVYTPPPPAPEVHNGPAGNLDRIGEFHLGPR